ncbi:MAG: L-seryl-tRNA(Sec) selenium transferase, partial [Gemmatimonadales bacterium]|nr:L-seryl-tRNA(Sec) selenium transferase [Gemmatimonadales bacterium]
MTDRRRELPSVDRLLLEPEIRELLHTAPRLAVVDAVRESIAAARTRRGGPPENWASDVRERLSDRARASLRPVLNATGVV